MSLPSFNDLKNEIHFDEDGGHIWLGEHRMLLLHSSTFGAMRSQLIKELGFDRAKGMLLRMGCASGKVDAQFAKKIRPDVDLEEAFLVGPQLHALEGIVRVEPIKLEIDIANGHYYGEFYWDNSFEAEEHVRAMGLHTEPVCWNQIGYACGYTSDFMGIPILYKEVECVGCGDKRCRIVGKPVDQWDDIKEIESYSSQESIAEMIYSLKDEVSHLRSSIANQTQVEEIIGESPTMKDALRLLHTAADCDVTVLMLGETGVGKEIFSQALHKISKRSQKPFVAVNCAALPKDLVEAELFGVEKGAFTGADKSRPGRFERAHGGILFLDELGELSSEAQAKLLRILQTGEFDRVGDTATRKVDVRIIAATNSDLEAKVQEGGFRADLYYRLNVFPVTIPPLRDRTEDLPGLIKKFLGRYNVKYSKQVAGVTNLAMEWFKRYAWPGNIRELENVIERGVLMTNTGNLIDTEHLIARLEPEHSIVGSGINTQGNIVGAEESSVDTIESLVNSGMAFDDLEKQILIVALSNTNGNVAEAARALKMGDAQLRYRMKKYAIE
ncbi:MAG TPA: sigma-54-dependent Fis family transcriptional regulator [Gammaproteobacteria bacterium]|nr:sigma-54-dependent Fis family transcriptional regulator [Gammaproteobacteria bacterium]